MAEVASTAVPSKGTVIKLKDGASYVRLGDLTDVEIPGFDTEIIDATHQESPGMMREKLGGFMDPGEISATVRFKPASPELETIYDNATKLCDWQIEFAGGEKCTFKGILKSWKPAPAAVNGLLEGALGIAVSGPLTWTAAP